MTDGPATPELDLPEPQNPVQERIVSDIRQYGWHYLTIAPRAEPGPVVDEPFPNAHFAYTVGLSLTLDHPELILMGAWSHAPAILAATVTQIRKPHQFVAGDHTDELLEGRHVRFTDVTDRYRVELLTFADWITQERGFDALQLVISDANGRWPAEPGYSGVDQPLLAE